MKRPTILFVTGWASPLRLMQPVLQFLKGFSGRPLISCDWNECPPISPGDGLSPFASACREVVQDLDAAPVIIGWSTGAAIALELASRHPSLLSGLVLLSGTSRFCAGPGYTQGAPPQYLDRMVRALTNRGIQPVLHDFLDRADSVSSSAGHCETDAVQRGEWAMQAAQYPVASLHEGLRYLRDIDLREALPGISCPVLFIHGRQDEIIPVGAAQYAAGRIPHAVLHVEAHANHLTPVRHPAFMQSALAHFFSVNDF